MTPETLQWLKDQIKNEKDDSKEKTLSCRASEELRKKVMSVSVLLGVKPGRLVRLILEREFS